MTKPPLALCCTALWHCLWWLTAAVFATRVETISWKPRAYIYHNFMSEEECDHIVELARPLVMTLPAGHT